MNQPTQNTGGAPLGHPRRCTARRSGDGQPCRRWAARGSNVCLTHGASAPQVRVAAKRRLDQAADALVARLLGFALDGQAPDALALSAIRDALDRAGLIAPRTLDVALGPAPWMDVFDSIASGTRSQSRAARGVPDDEAAGAPEWVSAELEAARPLKGADAEPEIVDAEPAEPEPQPSPPRRRYGPPPVTGLDAITEAARTNGATRALPPPRALPAARHR